jgi:hypothetical protein
MIPRRCAPLLVLTLAACLCCTVPAHSAETSVGLGLGATAGFGVQGDFTFEHFTRDVPLSLRLSGAYSGRDAGHALDARRVFINNNTNGTPETSARTWQLRLDLLFPVATLGRTPLHLGLGARKAFFTGSFDYVGGNEKFDVTSDPWGVGAFLEAGFTVSDRLDFTLQLGLDQYFKSRLEGHDTAYEPDGDDVNPREDYTYDDADAAINQPKTEWFGLVGLRLGFGG